MENEADTTTTGRIKIERRTTTVTLPVTTLAKLHEDAFIERRSLSRQIEVAIEWYLASRKGDAA